MSLAVFAMVAWLVMIGFVLVPKWLTLTEMCFLYFIIGVLSVTVYTVLDVNLQWVPVAHDVEKSLALDVCRFIIIPFLLIMAAGFLNSPLRARWRWILGAAMMVPLMADDWLIRAFGLITFTSRWNIVYSILMYFAFIAVLALITRWFICLERGAPKRP
ncbi:hypothetical protein [Alicyclobacillus acidoterrestris]|uniref:Uncharacterized protein n=1 Tax=Alicyclobacillus acidoterrestris (strain ATCC 49025 / DSM 3922 / CIP 106132 / NCIMB 13137 / GD3B) TaxID=1356854 RepID=T0DTK9_ALIAG|nr:hypothetical protein [Alicyclobacillus acidoterrestris]EPZ52811.1 hypothetical protein N007_02475 [Alicyclobacillus acidoterrestris ATCC 49025]UNO48146.1 hypothetical protein K1I37_15890 [Alicyclobacillus acidoterrestris]